MQGRYAEAMDCYDRAIALDPAYLPSYLNRAAIWLLEEDYARGWQEYERRLANAELAPLHQRFGQPTWDGAPLAGRRILVYAEQGLGDEILFASCLPEVIDQAGHCIIDCDPRLAGLFRRSFPQATVHGGGQTDPTGWLDGLGPVDWKVPAGSLPLHLRRKPEEFPRHSGYLRAAPEQVAGWRERLQALGPGPKIGLSWRGGVPQTGRGSRSKSRSTSFCPCCLAAMPASSACSMVPAAPSSRPSESSTGSTSIIGRRRSTITTRPPRSSARSTWW